MLQVVGSIKVKQLLRTTHTAPAPKLQQYAHLFSWIAFKMSPFVILCRAAELAGGGKKTRLFSDSFIMHR